jgi:pSer/pThr/pTyr-binding forkhead associated (FHA) protein
MTHPDRQDGISTKPDLPQQDEAAGQDQPAVTGESGARAASEPAYGLKFILPSGESKLFTSLPISIGRAKDNDIVLADETVSAHHAQVYYDPKARDICILDLDSLNGLFIGDQPTRRNILYDGVKIGLGTASLLFRDTGFIYSG